LRLFAVIGKKIAAHRDGSNCQCMKR